MPISRIFAIALALGCAVPVRAASPDVREKQVLVVHSTRRTSQLVTVSDREIPEILGSGVPESVDYYTEFVDEARFPVREYQLAFRDFLRSKYRDQRFDLLIAMGDNALEFVANTRADLFPATPVVFFASGSSPRRPLNSTGVVARLNLSGSLELALRLQPSLRHVFVVSATDDSNRGYEVEARAQFQPFADRLDITYLSDLSRPDLEARLTKLPERSMVYFLTYSRHGADENFRPIEYLDRIAAVANAPTYSWVDSAMDRGIVGGSLKSQKAQADAVARVGLRLLRGERPETIPVTPVNLNVSQVNWRQLTRWDINPTHVPAGTIITFREPALWERYGNYIIAAVFLLLAQSALIAGLLIQKSRRRTAEHQVQENAAALRSSYDRIRDLGGRLLGAQEAERARIARELHDDVSQQLALLAFDLDLLRTEGQVQRRQADRVVRGAFDRAQDVARSVHDLSHRLHPARLQTLGLVAAIYGLERELSTADLRVSFSHEGVPVVLPAEITLCLFRVVQEALHNAYKHSAATYVAIQLTSNDPRGLALTIIDDGIGFNVDDAWVCGLGLVSMAERVESVGGRMEIRSGPGSGTRVQVTVPIPPAPLSQNAATLPVH